jgi:small GTP-binding protein
MHPLAGQTPEPAAHKIVILGDSEVGKTSIITRQMLGYQPAAQRPTIGCHCSEIHVTVDNRNVTLQVWDTAGQETYRALVPVYLRGARGAILVYDVTDHDSFLSLGHWHDILVGVVSTGLTLFVVGNKIDLEDDAVVEDVHAQQFATGHRAQLFKVSAATGDGLDALFEAIARQMEVGMELQRNASAIELTPEPQSGCC